MARNGSKASELDRPVTTAMSSPHNTWDTLWGTWIIEELTRNGIRFFCVSPGSRSTPLTVAVAESSQAQSRMIIDERAAAYFALGYARATGYAAALIATSGTAVANYLPAIIEASVEQVPMLVLTADRPPELHDCGANQTIKQEDIFGSYVRWFHNPGCPGAEMPVKALLSVVDYAVQRTQTPVPGPVHLNFPFREPFFADADANIKTASLALPHDWHAGTEPYVRWRPPRKSPDTKLLDALLQARPECGILSVGRVPTMAVPSIKRLAQTLGWPLFADVASGLRLGIDCHERIAYYDSLLVAVDNNAAWRPEAIWHLGAPPLSKRWLTFWETTIVEQTVWVANHPLREDPTHLFNWRIESAIGAFCQACIERLTKKPHSTFPWLKRWQELDAQTERLMARHFDQASATAPVPSEGHLARLLSRLIPAEQGFFIGNSLPVRMVDIYGSSQGTTARIAVNRGASGIDGLIASAAGYACGLQRPVTLLIGDISTLHDLNSLGLLEDNGFPVYVVICNNHGGGLFSFLPIAKDRQAIFEKFFGTPHQRTFAAAGELFGLDYHEAGSLQSLAEGYTNAVAKSRSAVIEVTTERTTNVTEQQRWRDFFHQNLTIQDNYHES